MFKLVPLSLFAACAIGAAAHAQQPPEDVFERYAQAIESGDLPALVAFHSDDVIFVANNGGPLMTGKAAIESYYKAVFANSKSRRHLKTTGNQWQVFGDTAIRTSNGMFEVETANGKNIFPLRNTYVFQKDGREWKLVNVHFSNRTAQAAPSSSPAPASR